MEGCPFMPTRIIPIVGTGYLTHIIYCAKATGIYYTQWQLPLITAGKLANLRNFLFNIGKFNCHWKPLVGTGKFSCEQSEQR